MITIPAQEIKRRGIGAVDGLIGTGDVHIIKNNQPQYVVLSEARYQDLIDSQQEVYAASVRASLEEMKAGSVRRFASASDLLNALETEEDQ